MAQQEVGASGEFFDVIFHGREERNIEYKGPMNWKDPQTKAKVTKACLAMANVRDGGWIVVGVRCNEKGAYEAVGMDSKDAQSFEQDHVQAYVNGFADPPVKVEVSRVEHSGKLFIVMRVHQFDQAPVICKKSGPEGLKEGTIYTRTRRMVESAPVADEGEMREILRLAVDEQMHDFLARMAKWGVLPVQSQVEDADAVAFREERKDLEEDG